MAAVLNAWATDYSWVNVRDKSDFPYWATAGKVISSAHQDEVIYRTRQDFIDFFVVQNAKLNCTTGQKTIFSVDTYSSEDGKQQNHTDFTKGKPLSIMLSPSKTEFKVACGN